MNTLQFLLHFLGHPIKTGAVAASSRRLAEVITNAAELATARTVVEFGCGTGVFTERIAAKLPPGAVFFALEINPQFVQAAQRRCPGVPVIRDSARNAGKHLDSFGRPQCDRIVCGLPWASFSEPQQDDLLSAIGSILAPGGLFLTFAYLQGLLFPAGSRFRRKLLTRFEQVTTTPTVWRNLPPAFVYCARSPVRHSGGESGAQN